MANKSDTIFTTQAAAAIREPEDGNNNVPINFTCAGVFNPRTLALHAQIRSSGFDDITNGNPISAVKMDGAFTKNADGTFTVTDFRDSDDNTKTVEPTVNCFLHLMAYNADNDPPANFVAHH